MSCQAFLLIRKYLKCCVLLAGAPGAGGGGGPRGPRPLPGEGLAQHSRLLQVPLRQGHQGRQ